MSPKNHIPELFAGPPWPLNQLGEDRCAQRLGFLLVPGFTYIGFASAIEPLRMANMVAAKPGFEALTIAIENAAVAASNGVRTLPDYTIDTAPSVDALFVCGPNPIDFPDEKRLIRWLQTLAHRHITLGGIDTGSYLLASAGLLDGYRSTIHWQDRENMLLAFPRIVISNRLYEIDRDRLTSGGGTAAMDMMLHFIAGFDEDTQRAAAVADLLVHDRIRTDREIQRVPLRQRFGTTQPRLRDVVAIMEANIEEPLDSAELAAHAGLSERQIERLFRDHLCCTPKGYYMELRLNIARTRLLYSEDPIAEIAHSCGFASSSYFSKCYRRLFGAMPSRERRFDVTRPE